MDYPDGPNLLTQALKNRELPLDEDKGSAAEDKVRDDSKSEKDSIEHY